MRNNKSIERQLRRYYRKTTQKLRLPAITETADSGEAIVLVPPRKNPFLTAAAFAIYFIGILSMILLIWNANANRNSIIEPGSNPAGWAVGTTDSSGSTADSPQTDVPVTTENPATISETGEPTTEPDPVPAVSEVKWSSVSLGWLISTAIADDGTAYYWGSSSYWGTSSLFEESFTDDICIPTIVQLPVTSFSFGTDHAAFITENGDLYLCGTNIHGQLGDSTRENRNDFVKIMENVASVSLGSSHSAAITKNGELYLWGWNQSGEVGNGTTEICDTPVKIMDNVAMVSLGAGHSAAISKDGELYLWGNNSFGQLGNNTTEDCFVPIKIMDNVASVSLGWFHTAVVTNSGELYMWGWNESGQLGNGTYENSLTPIKIMDGVQSVCLKYHQSAAITTNGELYMWGENDGGQLGIGTSGFDRNEPIKIMDQVVSVSLGDSHSAAITEDGSLYIWGENTDGQLGNGSKITKKSSSSPSKLIVTVSNDK